MPSCPCAFCGLSRPRRKMRNIAASPFAIRKWATVLRIPFMCRLQADYHYHEIDNVGRFFIDLEMAGPLKFPSCPSAGSCQSALAGRVAQTGSSWSLTWWGKNPFPGGANVSNNRAFVFLRTSDYPLIGLRSASVRPFSCRRRKQPGWRADPQKPVCLNLEIM
jgi:hypothetical protein